MVNVNGNRRRSAAFATGLAYVAGTSGLVDSCLPAFRPKPLRTAVADRAADDLAETIG